MRERPATDGAEEGAADVTCSTGRRESLRKSSAGDGSCSGGAAAAAGGARLEVSDLSQDMDARVERAWKRFSAAAAAGARRPRQGCWIMRGGE
jgi:hypothetical protein